MTNPEDAIAEAAKRCSNWGRWGPDDVLGTLNFLDEAKRREGAALVRRGVSFSSGSVRPAQRIFVPAPRNSTVPWLSRSSCAACPAPAGRCAVVVIARRPFRTAR